MSIGNRHHAPDLEAPQPQAARPGAPEAAREPSAGGLTLHVNRLIRRGQPGGPPPGAGADPGSADGVMALQRTAGNRAVTQLLSPVQRWPDLDEMREGAEGAAGSVGSTMEGAGQAIGNAITGAGGGGGTADTSPPAGGGAAPTAPTTPGPDDSTLGGSGATTVNGSSINLNAAMVTAPGVLQVDTVIANSVVGSSYTPGAGNIW